MKTNPGRKWLVMLALSAMTVAVVATLSVAGSPGSRYSLDYYEIGDGGVSSESSNYGLEDSIQASGVEAVVQESARYSLVDSSDEPEPLINSVRDWTAYE